jgi:hypothetical protein
MHRYKESISIERLKSYQLNETDSKEEILERYLYNIILSEALFPAFALFEITFRNKINFTINTLLQNNWLLSEVHNQKILLDKEHDILIKKYTSISSESNKKGKTVTNGKLLADLNLGFWVHLCKKKYYKTQIWNKPQVFDTIFPHFGYYYAEKTDRIQYLLPKLENILKFRNRVFHHEPIIKKDYEILKVYENIENILLCLCDDMSEALNALSRFKDVFNKDKLI